MKCRLCGRTVFQLPSGLFLTRVNRKGVAGVFECRPSCGRPFKNHDAAVLAAITGKS